MFNLKFSSFAHHAPGWGAPKPSAGWSSHPTILDRAKSLVRTKEQALAAAVALRNAVAQAIALHNQQVQQMALVAQNIQNLRQAQNVQQVKALEEAEALQRALAAASVKSGKWRK